MCWVASDWFGSGCYGLVNLWFVSVVSFLFGVDCGVGWLVVWYRLLGWC